MQDYYLFRLINGDKEMRNIKDFIGSFLMGLAFFAAMIIAGVYL